MTRTRRSMLAALLTAGLALPALAQQDHEAHHPEAQAGAAAPSTATGAGEGSAGGATGGGMAGGMGAPMMGGGMMGGMQRGPMMDMHGMMMGDPGEHMAGRLAFLKAELGVAAEQEDEWEAFASAVRDAAEGMRPMRERMRGMDASPPLPERLRLMEEMMTARLDAMRTVHEEAIAFYETLDETQKAKADAMMGMM